MGVDCPLMVTGMAVTRDRAPGVAGNQGAAGVFWSESVASPLNCMARNPYEEIPEINQMSIFFYVSFTG